MIPLVLLLIGCLIALGITVLSVMLMMYRRRGTTSPVHVEPYMKQPIISPPDSRNNSMLDVTHGDHTYFVEYTLKQVADYALNNQPDIIQSPQGQCDQKRFSLRVKFIHFLSHSFFTIFDFFRPRENQEGTPALFTSQT